MASKVISHGKVIYRDDRGDLTYRIDVRIDLRGVFYSIRKEHLQWEECDHTSYVDLIETRQLAIQQMQLALDKGVEKGL